MAIPGAAIHQAMIPFVETCLTTIPLAATLVIPLAGTHSAAILVAGTHLTVIPLAEIRPTERSSPPGTGNKSLGAKRLT